MSQWIQAQSGFGIYRHQAHGSEQATDSFGPHPMAPLLEPERHLANSVKGMLGIFLVQQAHVAQVLQGLRLGLIIVAGRRQAQQLALAPNRQLRMLVSDPFAPPLK